MQRLLEMLEQALSEQQLSISQLSALASSAHKQHETGLLQLAIHLQVPLYLVPSQQLARYNERLSQHSSLSLQITGSAGVAQASALAVAERSPQGTARLLGERCNNANATCAIAHLIQAESL
ncbi:MAG: cobalamin biosynthesis protein [Pseudomonadaceae bacterium]|nr:cobalamin biosynthesis protein [Pseudomonadaceae bacterium]